MMKGKRSKRPRPSMSPPPPPLVELNTSTTSSSDDAWGISDHSELTHDEEEDMANCLILLARSGKRQSSSPPPPTPAAGEVYQCKTCEKSFSSFQALGGHRASHKKSDKSATTTLLDQHHHQQYNNNNNNFSTTILSLQISSNRSSSSSVLLGTNVKSRVHECSLCGAEFASGQALGGHMRRHRPIVTAPPSGGGGGGDGQSGEVIKRARNTLALDLNLPAPEEQAVIVFSASPLIDCLY